MLDGLRLALLPWYAEIRFVHLLFVMVWFMSTAVAYTWYVKSAWLSWQRQPDDAERRKRRDWTMEQFDKGAIMEHIAFPIVIVSGLTLYWITGWSLANGWLLWKLLLIVLIFVPMEIVDYWLAHFGGNKEKMRATGDMVRYEQLMQWHWLFFRITTPLVMIFIPVILFLAITKPF